VPSKYRFLGRPKLVKFCSNSSQFSPLDTTASRSYTFTAHTVLNTDTCYYPVNIRHRHRMGNLTHYGLVRCVKCGEGQIQVMPTSFSIHHSDIPHVVHEAPMNQSRILRVHMAVILPRLTFRTVFTAVLCLRLSQRVHKQENWHFILYCGVKLLTKAN